MAMQRLTYDGTGKPYSLFVYCILTQLQVELLSTGRLGYKHTNSKGKQANFLQEEILHIRYHSDDGILGKPVQSLPGSIG